MNVKQLKKTCEGFTQWINIKMFLLNNWVRFFVRFWDKKKKTGTIYKRARNLFMLFLFLFNCCLSCIKASFDRKVFSVCRSVIQGVECFDYSHNLNVICTGGVDHAVRLWNPYVTAKPVAIMKGHLSFIIDLAIHEALEQVFSYDKDGVRK